MYPAQQFMQLLNTPVGATILVVAFLAFVAYGLWAIRHGRL